jgi:hypothetical protein
VEKVDDDDMIVQNKADYDVTKIFVYNVRDSDVRSPVLRTIHTCDICVLVLGLTSRF